MIEPKIFYRKLDSLLSKISLEKSSQDYVFKIVQELENTFGYDLRIGNGRVYEAAEGEYILVYPSTETEEMAKTIKSDSEAISALLSSKTYIFDNPDFTIDNKIYSQSEYKIPAAITVRSPESRWLCVFELKSGWLREEVEFCLNAVRTYLNYRLYSESVKSEMEQAAHIQQSLLPASAPEISGFDICGRSVPAEIVGGDLYDYFDFDNDVLGICIGDASGHGLPAALLVRDVVTGLRMGLEKHMEMVYTFQKLNKVIYRSVYSTSFISLFYAEIEKNGNIFYVNAGHPSPLLFSAGVDITELESTGLIFGALPEIQLSRSFANMKSGDILVLYTDGIFERKNPFTGEDFGIEGIKKTVIENKDLTSEVILDKIFLSAFSFGLKRKWEDDATIMVIKKD
ncbi:MAG: PP2C family protein-serine/threonine phosphatase [Melioribacteraceae bacterium]|nr:PP2C family protein-serine/threonine phosphatase [Melioribacteraceae bacterium]